MKLSMFAAALVALGLVSTASAQEASPPPPPVATLDEAADMAAARAAVPLMKTRPSWVSGPEPEFPESERAAGHHGEIVVSGLLGTDGKLRYAHVKVSSGAPVLDALALEAAKASVFTPAKDADGKPLAIPMSVPQEFYSYKSDEVGGGLIRYSCRQFVLDMDWWRATFPNARWSDHELYTMMVGVGVLGSRGDPNAILAVARGFEPRWLAAIEKCRKKPEKRFVDMIQPEGKLAEALAKSL